jgi:ABC-type glycerol-3-phosphate transport system substrate-binding protein
MKSILQGMMLIMLRKITVFVYVILLILFWSINISASADIGQPSVALPGAVTDSAGSYDEYRKTLSGIPAATVPVSISAGSYVEATGVTADDSESAVSFDSGSGSVSYQIEVSEPAVYNMSLAYTTMEGLGDIELGILIDGAFPFKESSSLKLKRNYSNGGKKRTDAYGNEISPEQTEVTGDYETTLSVNYNGENMLLYLAAGVHQISIQSKSTDFALREIKLGVPESMVSYAEYLQQNGEADVYDKNPIYIEGEAAVYKSQNNLIPLSDNSSVDVYPHDAVTSRLNYIGGRNWDLPGESITWEIPVDKAGYYQLGINYRQRYTLNTVFYRELRIDGRVPFAEVSAIPFEYARGWTYRVLADDNDEPYLFYLDGGVHFITLTVTQGPVASVMNELEELSYNLASFYRSMVVITGDSPDLNRDYNLFQQIPDFLGKLESYQSKLESIAKQLESVNRTKGAYAISTVNNMMNVIEKMTNNKYSAHRYIKRYYSCYASLSAMQLEMSRMPLDIDALSFSGDGEFRHNGIIAKIVFSFRRFISAFYDDYSRKTANADSSDREQITVWVNWGRDQVQVLQYLTQSNFSVKHDINVEIKLTNATLLQAILSGNGPDCALQVSRSEPINLAIREGVYNLTNFDDYEQVLENFQGDASAPYWYERDGSRGLYALPDTQNFYMMFIRTDIFNELGLKIPTTWEEFDRVSDMLLRQNMQVGLPYVQITEMTQVNRGAGALSIFPTLLLQKGGSLYNEDLTKTMLLSDVSIEAFEDWVNYYVKRSFPLTYDFFSRFRLGLMPMAIQSYSMYATIKAAATEIDGYWGMYPVPGTVDKNGNVSNTVTGGGTGCLILNQSENKKAAWEYLKWWVSEDVQYQYCRDIETQLGASARVTTANVNALSRLEWDRDNLKSLMEQWKNVTELAEVPGGYYVSRVLDQAFWNSVNAGENAKDSLLEWAEVADAEIARKRAQYE